MREVYRFASYRLDVDARRLTLDGETVAVTLRGFDLLLVLVRQADRAVPRSRLLEEVWRDVVVEEGNLDTHVSALRKALSAAPGAIETVRGFGYRFAAEVIRVAEADLASDSGSSNPAVVAAVAPDSSIEPAAGLDLPPESQAGLAAAERTRSKTTRVVALAASAVVMAVAFWVAIGRSRGSAPTPPAVNVHGLPTLAVLPFANLSQRAEDAWLATALREILTTEVSRAGRVAMIAGETVAVVIREAGTPTSATLPAEMISRYRDRLGADLVLAGTFLVVGEARQLRLDLRLYDTRSGESRFLWSDTGTVGGLLPIVARAGQSVRNELGVSTFAAAPGPVSPYPESAESLEHYANGVALLRQYHPRAALDELELAVAASPGFALARGALADVLGQLGRERQARDEAKRALDLASGLPDEERLRLEGRLYALTNQWPRAIAVARELTARFPDNLDYGLALASAFTHSVDARAALRVLDDLAALPAPKGADPRIDLERGWADRVAGDFEGMRSAGERAVEKGRRLGSTLIVTEGLVLVSWAELTVNRWSQGLEACEEGAKLATQLEHDFLRSRHLGLCGWNHLDLGELDEAEKDFREALLTARRDGDLDQATDFLFGLGIVAANRGQIAEREGFHLEGLQIAREAGDVEAEVGALGGLAEARLQAGNPAEAEPVAREAVELARKSVSGARLSNVLSALAETRMVRGDTDEARRLYREAIDLRLRGSPSRAAWIQITLAWVELVAGRPKAALVEAGRVDAMLAEAPDDLLSRARLAATRAEALARLGRATEAEAQLANLDATQRSLAWGPGVLGDLDLTRASVLERLGRRDEAERLWGEIARRPDLASLVPSVVEARYRLARSRAERLKTPEARAALDAVIGEVRERKMGSLLGERL